MERRKKIFIVQCSIVLSPFILIACFYISGKVFGREGGCGGCPCGNPIYEESQIFMLTKTLMEDYDGNGRLLLICEPFLSEQPSQRLKGFAKVIREASEGKIKEVVFTQIKEISDDLDEDMMEEIMIENSAEDFNKVIDSHSDCDVVIIMCSLPYSVDELYKMGIFELIESPHDSKELIRNPERKYPVVGIHNGFVGNSLPLFYDNFIHAMTLWKPNPVIDEVEVTIYEEAFERRFFLLTPENLEEKWKEFPKLFPPKESD